MDFSDPAVKKQVAGGCGGCCVLWFLIAVVWTFVAGGGFNGKMYIFIHGQPLESSTIWDMKLKTLSVGAGFDNIINMDFTFPTDQAKALPKGAAWVADEPVQKLADAKELKCSDDKIKWDTTNFAELTAAIGLETADGLWAFGAEDNPPKFMDGTPWCFSWPFLGAGLSRTDIEITLNTGEKFNPNAAATFPNIENNEKHCIVFFTNLINRIKPQRDAQGKVTNGCAKRSDATEDLNSCAFFPVKFEIVGDLDFVGPPDGAKMSDGPWGQDKAQVKNGKGLINDNLAEPPHPYEQGPTLIGAHLTRYSNAGDSGKNDCEFTFPKENCVYRLRFYYTGGYTPNGISGIRPTDFATHWRLVANDNGAEVQITETGKDYKISTGGTIHVVGLSDLGTEIPAKNDQCATLHKNPPDSVDPVTGACYDKCYSEDHDNYIDIIMKGDDAGMKAIKRLEQPSDGTGCYRGFYDNGTWSDCQGYQPVFNPGGGGNIRNGDPATTYFGNFVAGSKPVTYDVTVDLEGHLHVTYDDGAVSGLITTLVILWGLTLIFCCGSLCAGFQVFKDGRESGSEDGGTELTS